MIASTYEKHKIGTVRAKIEQIFADSESQNKANFLV